MGYNKLVLFLNDADDAVTEDPKGWWEKCKEAFHMLHRQPVDHTNYTRQPVTFGHGHYGGYWSAVWEKHADEIGVIIVGGNCATVVGTACRSNANHREDDVQVEILKEILERKGYTIRKKPAAKSRNKA